MKLQIVLNTPSVPALINPPKKISPNFSTKNLRVEKIPNPKKYFNHSRHLRFRVPTPGEDFTQKVKKIFQVRITRNHLK